MLKLVIVNHFMDTEDCFYELYYNDIEIASGACTHWRVYTYKHKIGVDMYNNDYVTYLTTDVIEYE